jgi:hypothetical protein
MGNNGKPSIIGDSAASMLRTLIAAAGELAAWCFLEFFTVNIRNKNTRTRGLNLEVLTYAD